MNSKLLYFKIVLRVVFLVFTALLFAYAVIQKHIDYSIFIVLIIIFQVVNLIKFLNHTNREIAYFFKAIENNDSSLHYPVNLKNSSLQVLHENLNNINELIREKKIQYEIQEKYFQRILEEASIGVLTFNKEGHIITANNCAKNMLGRNPLTHLRQLKQVEYRLFSLISDLKPFDPRIIQVTNEREVNKLSVKATYHLLNEEELLLVVIQNINSEMEHSEIDSYNKLFSVLTHEIMNSVTPITSLTEALLEKIILTGSDNSSLDLESREQIAKGLNLIGDNSQHLTEFVESYQSLTRIPVPNKNILSVASLFEKIKILCSQEKGFNNVTFKINVSNNLKLFGDENQIIQVLVNIVKNSLQSSIHTPNGIISLEGKKEHSGRTVLKVGDNGPGIPEELKEKIFIPFFTTKIDGTGIGLSLSKHIMRLHGGTIQVNSAPKLGTTFILNFPG